MMPTLDRYQKGTAGARLSCQLHADISVPLTDSVSVSQRLSAILAHANWICHWRLKLSLTICFFVQIQNIEPSTTKIKTTCQRKY